MMSGTWRALHSQSHLAPPQQSFQSHSQSQLQTAPPPHDTAQLSELRIERDQLESGYEELQHNYNIQLEAFRSQTIKLQDLDRSNQSLLEENAFLTQSHETLQRENARLTALNTQISSKYTEFVEQASLNRESLSHQQQSNTLLAKKVDHLKRECQSSGDHLTRVSKERYDLERKSRAIEEDIEISQEQIKRVQSQIQDFVDRVPSSITKDLVNISQTRLILAEMAESSNNDSSAVVVGISQQIQASFKMFAFILADTASVLKRYSDLRQENRILSSRMANLERQQCSPEEWLERERRTMTKLEEMTEHKQEAQKQLKEAIDEMTSREHIYIQNKKQLSLLAAENEKLKTHYHTAQKLIEKLRGQTIEASSHGMYALDQRVLENQCTVAINEKRNLEALISLIVSKIQSERVRRQVVEILECNRQKEQINKQALEFEALLEKHETDLKATVKHSPLSEDNYTLRKEIETNRIKFAKSAQAIKILEAKIEKEVSLIQRLEFLDTQRPAVALIPQHQMHDIDPRFQDVKDQLNDLKNYVYS